ncbi:uncharacterized protein LOC122537678 [Frieseomelitta varia]|uniref:uncharacterized protein LOC122537678 n=1 Tax=Frieseomelitta varia TaxID=561572 RepID=UPI001CB68646|nr:uncharacterized protein LOC122537678 [Frieseomelitta varia]
MKHRRGTKEGGKQIRKRLSQFHWWLQDRSRLVRWVVLLDRRQASAEFSTATLTNSRGIHSIADQKARCLHSLSLHSLRLHERMPLALHSENFTFHFSLLIFKRFASRFKCDSITYTYFNIKRYTTILYRGSSLNYIDKKQDKRIHRPPAYLPPRVSTHVERKNKSSYTFLRTCNNLVERNSV